MCINQKKKLLLTGGDDKVMMGKKGGKIRKVSVENVRYNCIVGLLRVQSSPGGCAGLNNEFIRLTREG